MQHWTWVMGRAQQLMMEHLARQMGEAVKAAPDPEAAVEKAATSWPGMNMFADPGEAHADADRAVDRGPLDLAARARRRRSERTALEEKADKDRRFAAKAWQDNPLYDTIRQTYLLVSERMLGAVDAIEGVDEPTAREAALHHPRLRRCDGARPISR